MSKRDIIVFLFKWKYSLIGYLIFVVAVVTVFVYLMPQKYEATVSVLVEGNRAPVMRTDLVPGGGLDQLGVLNSEVAIAHSRTVLAAAIDKVPPGEKLQPTMIDLALDTLHDWMVGLGLSESMSERDSRIKSLEDSLNVELLPSSQVIQITLKGKSPKMTAAIVNAVTESYIDQHLKVFSAAGSAALMRQQLDRLGRDLDARRKELKAYKQQASVLAMSDTQQALVNLQSQLTLDINKARNDLAELQTLYGAKHTKVKLSKEKLGRLESELQDTVQKLKHLEAQEGRIREMDLDISSMEKSYQDYQKRYEDQRLDSLSNPQVINVRVIEYASVPTRPKHTRIFFILLGLAGGALLTVAIALIREYFDHRVSDPDLAQQLLGVPALGSLERT